MTRATKPAAQASQPAVFVLHHFLAAASFLAKIMFVPSNNSLPALNLYHKIDPTGTTTFQKKPASRVIRSLADRGEKADYPVIIARERGMMPTQTVARTGTQGIIGRARHCS